MGIFEFIYSIFAYILKGCSWIVGNNYTIALLLFAVAMKILMFPLGIKQQKNMVKQAKLRPKEMAIRKRYAGRTDRPTQEKMNQEVMELYQKEHFNPMGGCLPLLLQMPIIFALYEVIRNPLQYLCNFSKEIITKISEISGIATNAGDLPLIAYIRDNMDSLTEVLPEDFALSSLPNFKMFGVFDLAQSPSAAKGWLLLIPVIVFAGSYLSMKLTRKFTYQSPQQQDANAAMSMKIMDFSMPLMSAFFAYPLPGVIGIYWLYQNLLGVVQQFVLSKIYPTPVISEEEMKQIEKEMNGTQRREKPTEKKRSLHHIDDDDRQASSEPPAQKKTEKTDAERPTLKEDRRGAVPAVKQEGTKKRSLHHIDDEDTKSEQ